MSAAETLRVYLERLAQVTQVGKDKGTHYAGDSGALAEDIANLALTEVADNLASALIFDPQNGVLRIAYGTATKREHEKAKCTLLEFLSRYIEKNPRRMLLHASDIKTTCLRMFSNDASAKVKNESFQPLTVLIQTCHDIIPENEIAPAQLLQKYLNDMSMQSKLPTTVKGSMLRFFGVLVRYYPDATKSRTSDVIRIFTTTLEQQLLKRKEAERALLLGALEGIDNFLTGCHDIPSANINKIYSALLLVLDMPLDLSRYDIPRAGLQNLLDHASLFRVHFPKDYRRIYTSLNKICQHQNKELSSLAFRALDVFLNETATAVGQSNDPSNEKVCFWFFLKEFNALLDTKNAERDMSIAIKGYGYFAAQCRRHLSPDDFDLLINRILQKGIWVTMDENDNHSNTDGIITHIASYISAYTHILVQYQDHPQNLITALNQLVSTMLVHYPHMNRYARESCNAATQELLWMLYNRGKGSLRHFASQFLYNNLIYTCIGAQRSEVAAEDEVALDIATAPRKIWKDMLYLWQSIFKSPPLERREPNAKSQALSYSDILCDEMMSACLRFFGALNLGLQKVSVDEEDGREIKSQRATPEEVNTTVDINSLTASNRKDLILFINFVDFFQTFVPSISPSSFLRWVPTLSSHTIELSKKHPLISGFYKILSTIMDVCRDTEYFATCEFESSEMLDFEDKMQVASIPQVPQISTGLLVRSFVRTISQRLHQYTDELLVSCLHLVLCIPFGVLDIVDQIYPVKLGLEIGISEPSLSVIALEAIETWMSKRPGRVAEWAEQVVPSFSEYLLMDVKDDNEIDREEEMLEKRIHRQRSQVSKSTAWRRNLLRRTYNFGGGNTQADDDALQDIQLRILRVLGRLGAHNAALVTAPLEDDRQAKGSDKAWTPAMGRLMSWDPEKRLKLKVPFSDEKIDMPLGDVLPRVIELAEFSVDRKVRTAACEFLHAVIVMMIGLSAFRARDSKVAVKSPYHSIYAKVFPVMLRLAIDIDPVPRQLFRPLVDQIIHWLTNNAQYENPETIALLNCCLNATCSSRGSLRDFGADCIFEFAKWSIKQSSVKHEDNPMNMRSLLKRICALATHPTAAKRLAAALIVNRIYRLFREEATFVDQFTFELLFNMLRCLKLSEHDPAPAGTRLAIISALRHIQRIIIKKKNVFSQESKARRKFPGLVQADLYNLIDWLATQICQPQRTYSRMCRELISTFVPLIDEFDSPGKWLRLRLRLDPQFLERVMQKSAMTRGKDLPSNLLISFLECYDWLLRNLDDISEAVTPSYAWMIEPVQVLVKEYAKLLRSHMTRNTSSSQDASVTDLAAFAMVEVSNILTLLFDILSAVVQRQFESGKYVLSQLGLWTNELAYVYSGMLLCPWKFSDSGDQVATYVVSDEIIEIHTHAQRSFEELRKRLSSGTFSTLTDSLRMVLSEPDVDILHTWGSQEYVPARYKLTLDSVIRIQSSDLLEDILGPSQYRRYLSDVFGLFQKVYANHDPLHDSLANSLMLLSAASKDVCRAILGDLLHADTNNDFDQASYSKLQSTLSFAILAYAGHFVPLICGIAVSPGRDVLLEGLFVRSGQELGEIRRRFWLQLERNCADLGRVIQDDAGVGSLSLAFAKGFDAACKDDSFELTDVPLLQNLFSRTVIHGLQEGKTVSTRLTFVEFIPTLLQLGRPHAQLNQLLDDLLVYNFPASYKNLIEQSTTLQEYKMYLNILLDQFTQTGCMIFLRTLLMAICREGTHYFLPTVSLRLSMYARTITESHFFEIASLADRERHADITFVENYLKTIIIPVLEHAPITLFRSYFLQNLSTIMSTLKQSVDTRAPTEEIQTIMKRKALSFNLLKRLPAKDFEVDSPIGLQWQKSSKQKLTIDVVSLGHTVKSEKIPFDVDDLILAKRHLNQAAYNAIAAAILCTQSKPSYFLGFLLQENEAKGQMLWENIIDTNATISLEEFPRGQRANQRLKEFRAQAGLAYNGNTSSSVRYLSSQWLVGTSLSQEPSTAGVTIDTPAEDSQIEAIERMSVDRAWQLNELETELDIEAIDDHPCFRTLLAVVQRLHLQIQPPDEGTPTMPSGYWGTALFKKFSSKVTPINIKVFIARVISVIPTAFEPCRNSWIPVLTDFICQGDKFGTALNCLVQDMCALVLGWSFKHEKANEANAVCAERLLSYLLRNVTKDVNRIVLEYVKVICQIWGRDIMPPTQFLFDKLDDQSDTLRTFWLSVISILVANSIAMFTDGRSFDGHVTFEVFWQAVGAQMRVKSKSIYAKASEEGGSVIAFALAKSKENRNESSILQSIIENQLAALGAVSGASDLAKWILCTYAVVREHEPLASQYANKILFYLPSLNAESRCYALNILACAGSSVDSLYSSLVSKNFLSIIRERDISMQIASLKVIKALLPQIRSTEAIVLVETLRDVFRYHRDLECLKLYFRIMMDMYERDADYGLATKLKPELLRGLVSSEPEITEIAATFWVSKLSLSTNVYNRLQQIISDMYEPLAEDSYVGYASALLWDISRQSKAYHSVIFDEPLPNARFDVNYQNIITTPSFYASTSTPLFAASQTQQSLSASYGGGGVRATVVDLDFTPTQQAGAIPHLGDLSIEYLSSDYAQTKSTSEGESLSADVALFSRRGRRSLDPRVSGERFAKITEENRRRLTVQRSQKGLLDRKVAIMRQYRKGELPDIQIRFADLLEPLMSLFKGDHDISTAVFSSLVTAIVRNIVASNIMNESEVVDYRTKIARQIDHMLSSSMLFSKPFVTSVLTVYNDIAEEVPTPNAIARACLNSDSHRLGILVMTGKALFTASPDRQKAKRRRTEIRQVTEDKAIWLSIARLYQGIDELDVYRSIFHTRIATSDAAKRAIDVELSGDFGQAYKLFSQISASPQEESRACEDVVCEAERLDCLRQLGRWDVLSDELLHALHDDISQLLGPGDKFELLPMFLNTFLKLPKGKEDEDGMFVPWDENNPNPALKLIADANDFPQSLVIMEERCSAELAIAALLNSNFDRAKYQVRNSYRQFLSQWANSHPLALTSRLKLLEHLLKITDVDDIVFSLSLDEHAFAQRIHQWAYRLPSKRSQTATWKDIIDNRLILLDSILQEENKYPKIKDVVLPRLRSTFYRQLSSAARQQHNFSLAADCLRQSKQAEGGEIDSLVSALKLNLAMFTASDTNQAKYKVLARTIRYTDVRDDATLKQATPTQSNRYLQLVAKVHLASMQFGCWDQVMASEITNVIGSFNSWNEVVNDLNQRAYAALQHSLSDIEMIPRKQQAKSYFALAMYCNEVLKLSEAHADNLRFGTVADYPRQVVEGVFLSMRLGHRRATDLVPRLLQLIDVDSAAASAFQLQARKLSDVWVMLRWLPQILAVLDKPSSIALRDIVSKLAKQYPEALYYPLVISLECYQFEPTSGERDSATFVQYVHQSVKSNIMERFAFELRRLTHPEHLVKDWVDNSVALFASSGQRKVRTLFQELKRLALDTSSPYVGETAKAFAEKYADKLFELCGNDGEKLESMSSKDFVRIQRYYQTEIHNKKYASSSDLLRSFSPWLADWLASDMDETMEVPGQYTGIEKPRPEAHAKIVKVDQRLLVMNSIRKPKRITLLASDELEHPFLVKGCEDLRLDQRIEQLFSFMNDEVERRVQSGSQKLGIRTYKVIPMSVNVGAIEWLTDTKPLRGAIESQINSRDQIVKGMEMHRNWVAKHGGEPQGYHAMFKAKREDAIRHFEQLRNLFPGNLLRMSMQKMASSAEAFHFISTNFASSFAAICIYGYLLGIGDRHLENFLIDLESGRLIPIDFGHAFGSATELLPVPELVPFRMTPQLQGFFEPLGVDCLLKHLMVDIMRGLREADDTLLNAMDVFVNEPLLDWKKHALKSGKAQKKPENGDSLDASMSSQDSLQWYPKHKLQIAEQKLKGVEPAAITMEEITFGHSGKPYHSALMRIMESTRLAENKTRNQDRKTLSVAEQVDNLVNIATDPNVLARSWVGWMSWM